MRLFKEYRLHQSDIALCMALHNELPESLAIEIRRLLETMGRKNFRSGLGKDDRVNVLTLHSTPVLKRSCRNARHEEKQKERELGWVRLARATLDQRLQTTTAQPFCKHTYHDRPLKS